MATTTKRSKKNSTARRRYAEAKRKKKPDANLGEEISTVDSYLFANRISRFNPDDLVGSKGLTIYRKMLQDEQVKAGIFTKQFATLSTGWEIVPPDFPEGEQEMADEIKEFVEFNFAEMEGGTLDSNMLEIMSGLAYGFSVTERVYRLIDFGDFNGLIGLKALKTRKPENFEFVTDRYGNLLDDGVVQNGIRLPAERFVIWSYRKLFNNFYGNSDLREAYRAWWLKEQILRFMVIALERYGEPITIFKHKGRITPATRTNLEDFIKGLQSKSGMILPDDIQHFFESPDVKTSDSYVPAINLVDTHIRIAILMPGLLGMSAEKAVGSLARSSTEFDVFLWVIGQLRQDLAETVINDQVIKPLVDMNYEVSGGNYPKFRFREITEEHKHTVFKMWSEAVKDGVLIKTRDDENKARGMIEFDPLPDEEEGEDEDEDEEENVVASTRKMRKRTEFEKRVDFVAIQRVLDVDTERFDRKIRGVMGKIQGRTLKWVEDLLDNGKLTARTASDFSLDKVLGIGLINVTIPPRSDTQSVSNDLGLSLQQQIKEMLEFGWRKGRDGAFKELPPKERRRVNDIKRFAQVSPGGFIFYQLGFEPTEALEAFDNRAWLIKGVIDDEIKKQVRMELFRHLEKGRPTVETIGNIRTIFEPFVGDPTKIKPSTGEALLQAPRLENIVRTESIWALNQGRVAVGDAAGDFVIGYQYSAIIDPRTSEVCRAADGLVLKKEDPRLKRLTPGLHFQCRSILIMVTQEDIPVKFSSGAKIDKAVRLIHKGFK